MNALYQIDNTIKTIVDKRYPYTNVIGLVRSMLALGLLLTLLFTNIHHLGIQNLDGEFINSVLVQSEWNFFALFGVEHLALMKVVAILLLLLVISGYFPQLTCFVHWWIASSFMFFSSVIDGGDQIHNNITLILIPLCLTDPRINHWHTSREKRESVFNLLGVFAIWVIKFQVAIIYLQASVAKYSETEWANGTALYYWLNNSVFGSQPLVLDLIMPILQNGLLISIITYGVMGLELILFAALFMSYKKRMILLPIALGFHFFIIIFHGIFSFFFSIAAIALLYLLPPDYSIKFNFGWLVKKFTSLMGLLKLPNLTVEKLGITRFNSNK